MKMVLLRYKYIFMIVPLMLEMAMTKTLVKTTIMTLTMAMMKMKHCSYCNGLLLPSSSSHSIFEQRDDVSNIAHGNNFEIVINGDIGDSVPGPINLYRPLPLHHEPLWRQSSRHRCPAEAILWRVQVIKYTS